MLSSHTHSLPRAQLAPAKEAPTEVANHKCFRDRGPAARLAPWAQPASTGQTVGPDALTAGGPRTCRHSGAFHLGAGAGLLSCRVGCFLRAPGRGCRPCPSPGPPGSQADQSPSHHFLPVCGFIIVNHKAQNRTPWPAPSTSSAFLVPCRPLLSHRQDLPEV